MLPAFLHRSIQWWSFLDMPPINGAEGSSNISQQCATESCSLFWDSEKKLPESFPHRQDRNGTADTRGVRQCFLNYCLGTGLGQQNLYYPSQAVHPSVLGHVSPYSVFANQTRLFQVPEETCRTGKPAANTHSESQTCNSQKVLRCSYRYQKNLLS